MESPEVNDAAVPTADGLLRWVHQVVADFAASPTLSGALTSIGTRGRPVLGVIGAVAWALRSQRLVIVDAYGYDDETMNGFEAVPLAAVVPLTDAVRTSVPVYLGSLAATRELYPSILGLDPSVVALAAVPLERAGSTVGVLGLSFDRTIDFTAEVRSTLEALGALCAAALGARPTADDPPPSDADGSLAARLAELEREVASMRELLRFIGDIAQRQLG